MRPGNIVTWAGHIRMPDLDKFNIGIVLEFKDCPFQEVRVRWSDGQDFHTWTGNLEVVS